MTQTEADGIGWRGTDEGGKLKATTTWNSPNTGATNSSGFSALSGGGRDYDEGRFGSVGSMGFWWSTSLNDSSSAWCRYLGYGTAQVERYAYNKSYGFSVRCVRN